MHFERLLEVVIESLILMARSEAVGSATEGIDKKAAAKSQNESIELTSDSYFSDLSVYGLILRIH